MGTKTQKLSNVVDQIVEWQSVITADGSTGLTAVAGRGYFIDTTSGTITVTLPASPKAGDIVQLKDYARTWNTNNVTLASVNVDGNTNNPSFNIQGQTVTLVYMDNTKGWSLINEDTTTNLGAGFITATGGTVTTSGDYKIHSFTGDGCFVVSQLGGGATPCAVASTVDYLVVGGGGGAPGTTTSSTCGYASGGGGAGGFRESTGNTGSYTASPLATPTGITITATTYPITVGAGGSGGSSSAPTIGTSGSNSVFSTITSAGGGYGARGGNFNSCQPGGPGGSGGGSGAYGHFSCSPAVRSPGGTGNTPPVSPPQGNPGEKGTYQGATGGGGGGGAGGPGSVSNRICSPPCTNGGDGGVGVTTAISGTPTAYAGGGGGGNGYYASNADISGSGDGGSGGGGNGGSAICQTNAGTSTPAGGQAGTANTGGGAGGSQSYPCTARSGNAGGKGIVIIRYKYQ